MIARHQTLIAAAALAAAALLCPAAPAVAQTSGSIYWQCAAPSPSQPAGGWCPASAANPVPTSASPAVGSTFAPAQTTLNSAAAVEVLASGAFNTRRLCNLDAAAVEYVGPDSATTTLTGFPIMPKTCFDVAGTTAAIYAIADTGTPLMAAVQY